MAVALAVFPVVAEQQRIHLAGGALKVGGNPELRAQPRGNNRHDGIIGSMGTLEALTYGYNLADDTWSWHVCEAEVSPQNPRGRLRTAWYGDKAYRMRADPLDALIDTLYAAIPAPPPASWRLGREIAIHKHFGVWIVLHPGPRNDYSKILTTFEDPPGVFNDAHARLEAEADQACIDPGDWDFKLAVVLNVLGITPTTPQPSWLRLVPGERPVSNCRPLASECRRTPDGGPAATTNYPEFGTIRTAPRPHSEALMLRRLARGAVTPERYPSAAVPSASA